MVKKANHCAYDIHYHKIMQIIKSITGRMMFKQFPELRKQLWGAEFLSDGGFVGTVGQTLGMENIKRYIKRQGSKDKKTIFLLFTIN